MVFLLPLYDIFINVCHCEYSGGGTRRNWLYLDEFGKSQEKHLYNISMTVMTGYIQWRIFSDGVVPPVGPPVELDHCLT
jgi:hypothetical protein